MMSTPCGTAPAKRAFCFAVLLTVSVFLPALALARAPTCSSGIDARADCCRVELGHTPTTRPDAPPALRALSGASRPASGSGPAGPGAPASGPGAANWLCAAAPVTEFSGSSGCCNPKFGTPARLHRTLWSAQRRLLWCGTEKDDHICATLGLFSKSGGCMSSSTPKGTVPVLGII
jgi:hypothetical protein